MLGSSFGLLSANVICVSVVESLPRRAREPVAGGCARGSESVVERPPAAVDHVPAASPGPRRHPRHDLRARGRDARRREKDQV
jgi:hypothetical protein